MDVSLGLDVGDDLVNDPDGVRVVQAGGQDLDGDVCFHCAFLQKNRIRTSAKLCHADVLIPQKTPYAGITQQVQRVKGLHLTLSRAAAPLAMHLSFVPEAGFPLWGTV